MLRILVYSCLYVTHEAGTTVAPGQAERKTTVCWISSARYSNPLNATDARKWKLLAELSEYELRVIGFSFSFWPRYFQQGAHFYLLPKPPTSLLRYLTIFALAPLLLLYLVNRHNARILVAQSPFEGAVAAWVKGVAGLFGKRLQLVIENHNNFEEDVFLQRNIPFKRAYRALMMGLARYAFRRGDALRVISSSTSERASHFAPELPQMRFMTFSDTDIFRRTVRSLPVQESLDIVYAGVLIPRKGVHLLLEAYAALNHPQAHLHLVGHAENMQYTASLRQQTRDLQIADRVHFMGAVPQQALADYFGKARVMVLPSLSEGLGRVVVEAMLLGTPVIGSRIGGIPDMLRDGENGYLVESGDVDELAAALRRIYTADVEVMGQNARESAEDFFSPLKYRDGYQRLFELVMGDDAADRART